MRVLGISLGIYIHPGVTAIRLGGLNHLHPMGALRTGFHAAATAHTFFFINIGPLLSVFRVKFHLGSPELTSLVHTDPAAYALGGVNRGPITTLGIILGYRVFIADDQGCSKNFATVIMAITNNSAELLGVIRPGSNMNNRIFGRHITEEIQGLLSANPSSCPSVNIVKGRLADHQAHFLRDATFSCFIPFPAGAMKNGKVVLSLEQFPYIFTRKNPRDVFDGLPSGDDPRCSL
jgi:hypothetical protein